MAENPRHIVQTALAQFIKELTAINLGIEDLREKELKIDTLDKLQANIQNVVNNLSLAARVSVAGTPKDKREFFYPKISASLPFLRSAIVQFQSLMLDTLSQTNPSPQELDGSEKLNEDKETLDKIKRDLIGKDPLQFDEEKIEEFITELLEIYKRAETFRNKEPEYFITIDGLQQCVRTVIDNLAMAADVIGEKNFDEMSEVLLPKLTESIPLLRESLRQYKLPEMDDHSQKEESA